MVMAFVRRHATSHAQHGDEDRSQERKLESHCKALGRLLRTRVFRRRKKRLAARSRSAPVQTKDLGGSGNAPGVMPAPPKTAATNVERRISGTTSWKIGGNETAQQPAPAEWQHPPGQLCGVFGKYVGISEAASPLARLRVTSTCMVVGAIMVGCTPGAMTVAAGTA
jgi:hypothetical protein